MTTGPKDYRSARTSGPLPLNIMHLTYDRMDQLRPSTCGSRRFWFDGQHCVCWVCVPPKVEETISLELNIETECQNDSRHTER